MVRGKGGGGAVYEVFVFYCENGVGVPNILTKIVGCFTQIQAKFKKKKWPKVSCCGLMRRSRMGLQQILTTVMTNIVVDKSTDNAEPLSICFLPQYSMLKKVYFKPDQNHDTKKEQALSITFLQYDWFISRNEHS